MSALGLMLMVVGGAAAVGGGVLVATSRGDAGAEPPDPTRLPSTAGEPAPQIPLTQAREPTAAQMAASTTAATTATAPVEPRTTPVTPAPPTPERATPSATTVAEAPVGEPDVRQTASFDPDAPSPPIGEPPEIEPVVIPPPSPTTIAATEAAPAPEPAAPEPPPVAAAPTPAEPVAEAVVEPAVQPEPAASAAAQRAPTPGLGPRERLVETLGALGVSADQAGNMFEQAEGLTQEYTELPPAAALAARCLNIIEFEDPGIFAQEGAQAELERFLKGMLGPSARLIWPQPGDDSSEHEVVTGGAGPVTELALPGFEYTDASGATQRLRALVRTS
jgi:nicotinate-nucleotide--dimethylbenzimidazole phosphoribosyltransferase